MSSVEAVENSGERTAERDGTTGKGAKQGLNDLDSLSKEKTLNDLIGQTDLKD